MAAPQGDGAALEDHLQQAARFGGEAARAAAALLAPVAQLPDTLAHLWEWFLELHSARQASFGQGGQPITHRDILAWAEATGRSPRPWEVDALRRIDAEWFSEINRRAKAEGAAP